MTNKYYRLGHLYQLLKEFHRIVFFQKGAQLVARMEISRKLKLDELDSYLSGLHTNLVEESVNKIKLTKRFMYGRNSFQLICAKLLLDKFYYKYRQR